MTNLSGDGEQVRVISDHNCHDADDCHYDVVNSGCHDYFLLAVFDGIIGWPRLKY